MGRREEIKKLFKKHIKADRVLELGCNAGHRRILNNVLGIDVFYRYKPEIVADLECPLPLKSETFDAVVGVDIIEHIGEIYQLIEECLRVLRKDGILMFAIPSAEIHGYKIKNIKKYGHKRMWSLAEFENYSRAFEIKNVELFYTSDKWFFVFKGIKDGR